MPTPTIPACVTSRLFIEHPRYTMSNILIYSAPTLPTTIDGVRAVGNAIFAAWMTVLAPLYSSTVTFRGAFTTVQSGSGSGWEDFTTTGTGPGTEGGGTEADESVGDPGALPAETALIVKKLTGKAGPFKRGRWFFGGVSENVQINGLIHHAFRDRVLAVCAQGAADITVAATGDFGGTTLHARHWDRKNNVLEPILACRADIVFGTRRQRRSPKPTNLILT